MGMQNALTVAARVLFWVPTNPNPNPYCKPNPRALTLYPTRCGFSARGCVLIVFEGKLEKKLESDTSWFKRKPPRFVSHECRMQYE